MSESIKSGVNYINLASALLLTGVMYMWYPMQRIFVTLFAVTYLIEIFTDKKFKHVKVDKSIYLYAAMTLFFLLAFVYKPFEQTSNYFFPVLERRISLAAFAVICLLGVNKYYKLSYFLNIIVISAVLAIFYIIYQVGIGNFIHMPNRFELFNEARIDYIGTHMSFNLYVNIGIIGMWYMLRNKWKSINTVVKILYFLAAVLFFIILSNSDGRSGLFIGLFILFGLILYEVFKLNKKLGVIAIVVVPLLFSLMIMNNKRMEDTIFYDDNLSQKESFEEKIRRALAKEPRLFIWESAWNIYKQKPVLGHGISDGQSFFETELLKNEDEEYRYYRETIKDRLLYTEPHSQYLQTAMEFGILGVAILLFIYFYPLVLVDKNRKWMMILILMLFLNQSIFDVFLTSQFSLIFGMILMLMLKTTDDLHLNGTSTCGG